jgi:hypothetical protein
MQILLLKFSFDGASDERDLTFSDTLGCTLQSLHCKRHERDRIFFYHRVRIRIHKTSTHLLQTLSLRRTESFLWIKMEAYLDENRGAAQTSMYYRMPANAPMMNVG